MDQVAAMGSVVFDDPQVDRMPGVIEISQPIGLAAQWQTPGLYLSQQVASNSLVRFIGEKVQTDYLQVIVVIDDDPEELLDAIFTVEQEMYHKFSGLRFDIRVRVIPKETEIETIQQSALVRYQRVYE